MSSFQRASSIPTTDWMVSMASVNMTLSSHATKLRSSQDRRAERCSFICRLIGHCWPLSNLLGAGVSGPYYDHAMAGVASSVAVLPCPDAQVEGGECVAA
jgi:hypothetical protein